MEIKTSLEAFNLMFGLSKEYHQKMFKELVDLKSIYGYPIDNIKRDLEVLELLKTRQVELKLIKASKDYKHYLNLIVSYNVFTDLTEQEYNLIKECLNEH